MDADSTKTLVHAFISSRRYSQHPSSLRNEHFTTRPECGGLPSHRHLQVRQRSVNADSRPTSLAQRSWTRGVQAGCHGPSVSGEQSIKVPGQLLHSSHRRCQSTSTISQPATCTVWSFGGIDVAHSVGGPSLSGVRPSGIHCLSTCMNRPCATVSFGAHWRRSCRQILVHRAQLNRDALCEIALYKFILTLTLTIGRAAEWAIYATDWLIAVSTYSVPAGIQIRFYVRQYDD